MRSRNRIGRSRPLALASGVAAREDADDAVACGLRLGAGDAQALADESIEQCGLAGVGFAGEGDECRRWAWARKERGEERGERRKERAEKESGSGTGSKAIVVAGTRLQPLHFT